MIRFTLLSVALLSTACWAADSSYRLAYSKTENVEVFVDHPDGQPWCSPNLRLRLAFAETANEDALARLVPRLGGLLNSQCPGAQTLSWISLDGLRRVQATGTASKVGDWEAVFADGSARGENSTAAVTSSAPASSSQGSQSPSQGSGPPEINVAQATGGDASPTPPVTPPALPLPAPTQDNAPRAQAAASGGSPPAGTDHAIGAARTEGVGIEVIAHSGAVIRVESCGEKHAVPVVIAKLPDSIKLETSTKSGSYTREQAVGGIFPVLEEALQTYQQSCPVVKGNGPAENKADVFLYTDRLPPIGTEYRHVFNFDRDTDKSIPVTAFHQDREVAWVIKNHPSDNHIKMQNAQMAEEKRQQQLAAKAAADKATVDRKKKTDENLVNFYVKHGLTRDPNPSGLGANPFAYQGENLMLAVEFEQMQSATTGIFLMKNEGVLIVNEIPKGIFIKKGKAILAANVIGNIHFDGVVGGLLQVKGMVPSLKYLGALLCEDQGCTAMVEK